MATHTYWRLYVSAAYSNYLTLDTIDFRNGGASLLGGGGITVTASSEYSGTYPPSKAVPGVPGLWSSVAGMPQWWRVQFASPVSVDQLQLAVAAGYLNEAPKDFTLQWSDDNAAWTDALVVTGAPQLSGSYDVAPSVEIDSVTPDHGPTTGGTAVTITGSGFTGATGATVGGVALTSFAVVNDTTITGITGAHAVGTVDVAVGEATLENAYTYAWQLTATPDHGPPAGGNRVRVARG